MGIEVTPAVGSGTTHEKEARECTNNGNKTGRRMRRDETAGEWVIIERKGMMLHRRVCGTINAGKNGVKNDIGDGLGVQQVHEVRQTTRGGTKDRSDKGGDNGGNEKMAAAQGRGGERRGCE
jgi:hypothetical protein